MHLVKLYPQRMEPTDTPAVDENARYSKLSPPLCFINYSICQLIQLLNVGYQMHTLLLQLLEGLLRNA